MTDQEVREMAKAAWESSDLSKHIPWTDNMISQEACEARARYGVSSCAVVIVGGNILAFDFLTDWRRGA